MGSNTANLWDNLEEVFGEPLSEDRDDDNEEDVIVKPEDQPACITADKLKAGGSGVLSLTKNVGMEIMTAVPTSNNGAHKAETVLFPASMEDLTMLGILADQYPTKSSLGKRAY